MSDTIEVSVVMSVFNGAPDLPSTIDSILSQEAVNLELIVVDDGSTDESARILEEYCRSDPRVHIVTQENAGLTRALARGCAAARGKFVARQDVGDISLPKRLFKQLSYIHANPDAALVSCGTRFIGPKGEHLYDVERDPVAATVGLQSLDLETVSGPSHHGSTMFSRELYERVGGYRPQFYFAQDLDLWLRLVEYGKHIIVPEVLYQASVNVSSISGTYRKEQIKSARLILDCARRRRKGLSEEPALEEARRIRPSMKRQRSRIGRARALYFIGVCLKTRKDPEAKRYFKQALLQFPLHFKSAARLLFR